MFKRTQRIYTRATVDTPKAMLHLNPSLAVDRALTQADAKATLYNGDCLDLLKLIPDATVALTVTSPPYCMGKEYEPGNDVEDFVAAHEKILPEIVRVTKPGGSICWQVGYYVRDNNVMPLDYIVFDILRRCCPDEEIILRNRVAWTFGHGQHGYTRFSGRHEMVLWFTKGKDYSFDLDAVRVQQKYPGKRASRGPNRGQLSGNPLGKNPSDVWDIPNVKANHIEKTAHPCQFPVALPRRFILALTQEGDLVLDPFAGTASTGVAALIEGRNFLGAEMSSEYCSIGIERLNDAVRGEAKIRPMNQEVYVPNPSQAVARKPDHFWPASQLDAEEERLG
ncbi:site-specific DNA-methyltransferase [Paraburkholderia sediminicola]|uniref:DNA-methyltransferase n=1 Tax=Paraburkholderia sediminicola TaxID=458836 RepID=UPI0038B7B0E6